MLSSFTTEIHPYVDEYGQKVLRIRALEGNEILGSLYGGYIEGSNVISLDSIHVNLALRGKGIGSVLIREFIKIMESEGIEEIVGEMKPEYGLNVPETIRFYKKHGFEVDENHALRRRL